MKAYQMYPFSRIEVHRGHIVVIKLCVPGSVTTDLLKEKSVSWALETEMISRASTLSESGWYIRLLRTSIPRDGYIWYDFIPSLFLWENDDCIGCATVDECMMLNLFE